MVLAVRLDFSLWVSGLHVDEPDSEGGDQVELYDLLDIRVTISPIGMAMIVLFGLVAVRQVRAYRKRNTSIKRSIKSNGR